MSSPKLSVFIPVFNAENYLKECLDSVINQSMSDLEIVIFDDGSTDRSYAICQSYAKKEPRIVLSRGKNGQAMNKMNEFLIHAKGEYIGFVDNDDFLDVDFFERMIAALQKTDADCAISSYTLVDQQRKPLPWYTPELTDELVLTKEETIRKLLTTLEIEGFRWNKICKKQVLLENHICFSGDCYPADLNGEYDILNKCKSTVLVNSHGYYYRQSNTSDVATMNKEKVLGFLKTFKRIAKCAKEQGMEKEAEYFRIWRSINTMFNTWKMRERLSYWNEIKGLMLWSTWIHQPLLKVFYYLLQYSNGKDHVLKFMVKTLIVRVAYSGWNKY